MHNKTTHPDSPFFRRRAAAETEGVKNNLFPGPWPRTGHMTNKTATALNGRGAEISHMAEKRLISIAPAGGPAGWPKKNSRSAAIFIAPR